MVSEMFHPDAEEGGSMFDQVVTSVLDAAAATRAPASGNLPVSAFAAWSVLLGFLGFAAVALWLLREDPPRHQKPSEPPSYRKAA